VQRGVVLLSGGIDSAVTLAYAQQQGHECHALSIDYGQRHRAELAAANYIARERQVQHRVIALDLRAFGGSALTSDAIDVPVHASAEGERRVPTTYVPARNTIFLALALACAEVMAARHIYIGANAVDYSGYPDCRPEYLAAFQSMADLATKAALDGSQISIQAPLLHLTKAQIIELGLRLGLNLAATVSCYQPDTQGHACGTCDACAIRRRGFIEAGVADPTRYQSALV
jgi:7-cyano-7-deazaguanine synthase